MCKFFRLADLLCYYITAVSVGVNCYIGIGSNLGNRYSYINRAMSLIRKQVGQLTAKSFIYESAPWGSFNGATFPYLNAVVLVASNLSPFQLLLELHLIENKLGRERSTPNAPRTIDLDLLYCGHQIISTKDLILPHPQLDARRFVLQPLYDIDPYFKHPVLGLSTEELLSACSDPQQELLRA